MGTALPQVLALFTYLQVAVILVYTVMFIAPRAKEVSKDVLSDDLGRLEARVEKLEAKGSGSGALGEP